MSGDRAQRAYDRLLHAQEAIERQRIGKLRSDIARVTRDERLLSQAFLLLQLQISRVAASDISQQHRGLVSSIEVLLLQLQISRNRCRCSRRTCGLRRLDSLRGLSLG
jgi:hypothetical protein